MWKTAKYVLCGVVGVAIGTTMTQCALWRMRPPLFTEYQRIKDEIYTKYLADGVLPAPSTFSASAQITLSARNEIQYTAKDGLSYDYGSRYPINIPLTGLLTLGFWWGGEKGCSGESEPPKSLIHNARLRAEKAR